ncbi:MAG TPA: ABC transporter ATP-binding protein [Candidatus Limnocylindrales bacterium]|nr:ABC transporter ATP-binding protein [Candidatus Limnocylindrales bacterium]
MSLSDTPLAPPARAGGPPVVLEARGLTKRFPGVLANDHIDLQLHKGEVLGLLGENGAGKSTLMNLIFGLYQQDSGEILVNGEPVVIHDARDAIARGIGMVHQHFQLIPVLTVTENVMLGDEAMNGPFLNRRAAKQRIEAIARQYRLDVPPDAIVEDLSVGAQQRVEIVKALYREADILILDEPTAVLTPQEAEGLFEVMRSLIDSGRSIIFISHKLKEVLEICDRVVVLRGGKVVGEADPKQSTEESLAAMMVGRTVLLEVDKEPAVPKAPVLEIDGLMVRDDRDLIAVNGLSLTVRAGEILGIAGVQGNGQTELVEAITGLRQSEAGMVRIDGVDVTNAPPRRVTEAGTGHIPEDRQKNGMVAAFSVKDNLVLQTYYQPPFSGGLAGMVTHEKAINANATALVQQYDVRTPGIDTPIAKLSGGNQQKAIVARELSRGVGLLIAAQPTRGLDVGSIEFIHKQIVAMRDEGAAVLLVSAELDEILSLSDTVAVMFGGRIIGQTPIEQAERNAIGLLMAGITSEGGRATASPAQEAANG